MSIQTVSAKLTAVGIKHVVVIATAPAKVSYERLRKQMEKIAGAAFADIFNVPVNSNYFEEVSVSKLNGFYVVMEVPKSDLFIRVQFDEFHKKCYVQIHDKDFKRVNKTITTDARRSWLDTEVALTDTKTLKAFFTNMFGIASEELAKLS